jgi:DNA-binding NarL/FixJ family response regulator
MTMKKEILIYENAKETLMFLRSFFKDKKEYSVHFIEKGKDGLKKELAKKKPDAVIISSPDGLRHLKPAEINCPVIALISMNTTEGIHSAVKSDVECYLLSPFHKEELDYTLRTVLDKKRWIESLYEGRDDLYALVEFASLLHQH